MIKIKDVGLKALIESNQGLHLSAYIKENENISMLKWKLKEIILDSSLHLSKVLKKNELDSFLNPIRLLLGDSETLRSLRGSIGLFRTKSSFKILKVPTATEDLCIVANSFHVKPILKSLQSDKSYLLLGIDKFEATLYRGSMGRVNLLSKFQIPKSNEKNIQALICGWFDENITNNTLLKGQRLYIAGKADWSKNLKRALNYRSTYRSLISPEFDPTQIHFITTDIKNIIERESEKNLAKSLDEYFVAEKNNLALNNIFKISRAASKGIIKKLIISEDLNIFGRHCKKTGSLTLHFNEKDHEDDDILDDLAQTVLMNGGEIIITKNIKMPDNFMALATLNKKYEELQTKESIPRHLPHLTKSSEQRRIV